MSMRGQRSFFIMIFQCTVILLFISSTSSTVSKREMLLDSNFPHIPWEVLKVAESQDTECSSTQFIALLLANSPTIPGFHISSEGKCTSRLTVSIDEDRWPKYLVTVQCSCERYQCNSVGQHCTTVLGPIKVLRRNKHNVMTPTTELLPIGCVCASHLSKPARVVSPLIL